MAGKFKPNRRGIRDMQKSLQKEFDKHPVYLPVRVDEPEVLKSLPATNIHNYHGPVIHGDANGAQLAWNNEDVSQSQDNSTKTIAPGYEALADAIVALRQRLPELDLDTETRNDMIEASNEVLDELTGESPAPKRIRRGLNVLKGVLAPISKGIASGVTTAVEPEAQEWASMAISDLSRFLN